MVDKDFVNTVIEHLKPKFGTDFRIETVRSLKNNGLIMSGIMIKNDEEHVTPVVYLDAYYYQYLHGMSMKLIVEDIYTIAVAEWNKELPHVDNLKDFEWVKSRIMFKLINWEKNKKRLEQLPYRGFLDLAIVYFVNIGETASGRMTMLVDYNCMEKWRTNEKKLYEIAMLNTPFYEPVKLTSLDRIIKEMGKKAFSETYDEKLADELLEPSPLYVLTNRTGVNGAAVMLYQDTLKRISEHFGGDLIILPSSIHDVMILQYDEKLDLADLRKMVHEINRIDVAPEEVLSDRLYLYDSTSNNIKIHS